MKQPQCCVNYCSYRKKGWEPRHLSTLQKHLNVNRKLSLNDYKMHFSTLSITIKKSSLLRCHLILANTNGRRAARLPELHLCYCLLGHHRAPHSAATCSLFCEDAEGTQACHTSLAGCSQVPPLLTSMTGVMFCGYLHLFPSQIAHCCSAGYWHYKEPASSNLPPLQCCAW